MSNSWKICRVVSSKIEAECFINHYKMKLQNKFKLFPIYCDVLKNF